ncbi:MAG: GNAT family N-acetyltransferase [Bryobacterales bacterium]|nr:GNAT family N-acetyltransferase [Bryobacterales bacterium]
MDLRLCTRQEYAELVTFLASRKLSDAGLAACLDTTWIARESGRIVGSVALELYGAAGLLRSVAVSADHASQGLGGQLVSAALELARQRGLTQLYLLTETAAPFFARRGFHAVDRARVPEPIHASAQFASACPQSALAMMRAVDAPHPVRPAEGRDAAAIAAIYNEGIADRNATFETCPREAADVRGWFDGRHPIVVALQGNDVAAFASTSAYRPRECYRGIAEYSVYVKRSARGQGFGRKAMVGLIDAATQAGYWKLVSRIFPDNTASRALMRSLGFREVGTYERHASLDGAWRDVVIVERLLA